MKKWPIFAVTAVLLVLYGLFVVHWFSIKPRAEEPEATTVATAAPTTEAVAETTAAPTTEPTTAPTLPVFEAPDETQLKAKHAFVYDMTFDQMLYTYGDQTERISPASLTKLFTVYVALQYLEEDTVLEVGDEVKWPPKDSSMAYIKKGSRVTVEMAVQGTLMQSGNDGAYILAVAAGRAIAKDPLMDAKVALSTFMAEVNAQLQSHGLTNTHFVTPDGYHKEGHYSTAEDLLQIAFIAMKQPLIMRYCAMVQDEVVLESGESLTWKNTNWMMRQEDYPELYVPEAVGLKTGGHSKAGQCVLALFQDGERELLIGVLGCEKIEERFIDAAYLFDTYRLTPRTYYYIEETEEPQTTEPAATTPATQATVPAETTAPTEAKGAA